MQSDEKERIHQARMLFYSCKVHSILRLTIPTSAYWLVVSLMGVAYLSAKSEIFLRCVWADLNLIMNAERFARIWSDW